MIGLRHRAEMEMPQMQHSALQLFKVGMLETIVASENENENVPRPSAQILEGRFAQ